MTVPYLQNASPAHGAYNIAVGANITVEVMDGGSGLDAASVELIVNGVSAWKSDAQQVYFAVTKTSITGGLRYVINPDSDLPAGAVTSVAIIADDGSGDILHTNFAFHTAYSAPVLSATTPSDGIIDVATGDSIVISVRGRRIWALQGSSSSLGRGAVLGSTGVLAGGIDASTVVFTIQGYTCYSNQAATAGFTVTKVTASDGQTSVYTINPHAPLPANTLITVTVVADDTESPANTLSTSFSFTTAAEQDAPVRTPMSGVLLDNVRDDSTAPGLVLVNRFPPPSHVGIDGSEPIMFTLVDAKAAGPGVTDDTKVWVTTNSIKTLVYDQGASFTAAGWTVAAVTSKSVDSAVDDVATYVLSHATSFLSQEVVTVDVTASNAAQALAASYSFTIEDTTVPELSAVLQQNGRRVRVCFDESMLMDKTKVGSALYTQDLSGSVSFIAPDLIALPSAKVPTGVEGMFIGVVAANVALNRGVHKILKRVSEHLLQVDAAIYTEDIADPETEYVPRVYLSGFRLLPTAPAAGVCNPGFRPVVKGAEVVSAYALPTGSDTSKYVDLLLHDDTTPGREYTLEAGGPQDLSSNGVDDTITFTSWKPSVPLQRNYSLWDRVPSTNREQDISGDMEHFVRCLDEVVQLQLLDVDAMGELYNPDAVHESMVDSLLTSMGCPFTFVRSLALERKRMLVTMMVPMYKEKGTAQGIEKAVQTFLATATTTRPYYRPADLWRLNASQLGSTTTMGPKTGWARYAFDVIVGRTLTAEERRITAEIVHMMRPAHTHFARLIEP
jgi:phage tail-like protein